MRWRMTRNGLGTLAVATVTSVLSASSPAAAQIEQPPTPDAGGGGFGGLIAVFVVVAIGISVWKFVSLRDMGIRRGMSSRDATTAAFFSDDEVTSTMILKPETTPQEPTVEQRLRTIDSLRARGVITEAEASSRRAEILDEI